jgi:hypothetical protein
VRLRITAHTLLKKADPRLGAASATDPGLAQMRPEPSISRIFCTELFTAMSFRLLESYCGYLLRESESATLIRHRTASLTAAGHERFA